MALTPSWFPFAKLFDKCVDEVPFSAPEGDGAPVTSCACGKTKIFWSRAQPAYRINDFSDDAQQQHDWVESRGSRKTTGEPVDSTLMWNDIQRFQNEEQTKWYRLRKAEWYVHGPTDFCVAECCSSLMCAVHPWYKNKDKETKLVSVPTARNSGIQAKAVGMHLFTKEAAPEVASLAQKGGEAFVCTGEKPEEAKERFQALAESAPRLQGKKIEFWQWHEKNINVLSLTQGGVQCGHIHAAEAETRKRAERAANASLIPNPLALINCCSRGGGRVVT